MRNYINNSDLQEKVKAGGSGSGSDWPIDDI